MALDSPPLGQLFVVAFDESDESFPIVVMHKDCTLAGYNNTVPSPWSACPYQDRNLKNYPNNLYVGENRYAANTRAIQKWMILPGPWIYDWEIDKDTQGFVFTKKRHQIPGNIKPFAVVKTGTGASVTQTVSGGSVASATITGGTLFADFFSLVFAAPSGGGITAQGYGTAFNGIPNATVVITVAGTGYTGSEAAPTILPASLVEAKREDIDVYIAWEIITVTCTPPNYSLATAIISYRSENRTFPGYVNALLVTVEGPSVGYQEAEALNTLVTVKTYYVISNTPPVPALDTIIPRTIYISGTPYRQVLHDAMTLFYGSDNIPVFFPGTIPTYSQYVGLSQLSGAITLTLNSTAITGSGTKFTTELLAGTSQINGVGPIVASITDDTHATFATTAPFTTGWPYPTQTLPAGTAYVIGGAGGWIGTLKNIAGSVSPNDFNAVYRVELLYMIMR